MTLTLTIANVDRLDNNASTKLVLDRHGALIGRSPNADWCLPDPKNFISYSHCEIVYRGGQYLLIDKSTNGTYVNGSPERAPQHYALKDGDELTIGHYRVLVRLAAAGARAEAPKAEIAQGWDEAVEPKKERSPWDEIDTDTRPVAAWQFETPGAAISGRGAMRENFMPPRPIEPASASNDVWGRYTESNKVDWGSLEAPTPPPRETSWGSAPRDPSWSPPPRETSWDTPVRESSWPNESAPAQVNPVREREPEDAYANDGWAEARRSTATSPVATQRPLEPLPRAQSELDETRRLVMPGAEAAWTALLNAAGLAPSDLRTPSAQAAVAAGAILRRLVSGLVVMLDARARAKAELGATGTTIELAGNNPLKFTRDPQAALARLINPAERGYMEAERAVEDAFKDLQAHQMATLAAMQGALRSTLQRFSPDAIRGRAERGGLLSRILPGGRESALWEAYEREFEGVVRGSDEAFMDTFAKAFRDAYQKACAEMKK